jgi:hypothetical protein
MDGMNRMGMKRNRVPEARISHPSYPSWSIFRLRSPITP